MTTNTLPVSLGFEVTSQSEHFPVRAVTGKETAPDGFILLTCAWKTTKNNPKPRAAVCTVAPILRAATCTPDFYASILHDRLIELQEESFRAYVEAEETKNATTVPASLFSAESIATFYRSQASGKRITSAAIGEWFDCFLAEPLMLALTERVAGITADQLAGATNGFKKILSSLAAPVPAITPADMEQAEKALSLAADSPLRSILSDKIEAIRKKDAPKDLVSFNL